MDMEGFTFNFNIPTNLFFGAGALSKLHGQKMPGRHAMVVISNGTSTIANGYLDRVKDELKKAGADFDIFSGVTANPLKSTVEEGARFAVERQCDFVVALGGGSVLDAAKAMAALATQPTDDLWDYAKGLTGAGRELVNDALPWIGIPTTSGTGSEIDRTSVITKPETNEKIGMGSHMSLYAKIAITDPELTISVPTMFSAYQGFDALFHNVEGFISRKSNVMSGAINRAAISNIAKYLPRVIYDGKDMEARAGVSYASVLGGLSMDLSSNVGQHGMEHALSAMSPDLPHGAGLIMVSDAYFTHYAENHIADAKLIDMARLLGNANANTPMDFVEALRNLRVHCGVDNLKMSDYGIKKEMLPEIAKLALATNARLFNNDTRPLKEDDILKIYEESYA